MLMYLLLTVPIGIWKYADYFKIKAFVHNRQTEPLNFCKQEILDKYPIDTISLGMYLPRWEKLKDFRFGSI